MGLVVKGSVQGQHSTDVYLDEYVRMVQLLLSDVEKEGSVELQVRAVRVARRTRPPGVYATGYEVHAPNSVELLIFTAEATGRPATLMAREVTRVGAILECLSKRLHCSWQSARVRSHGVDRLYVTSDPKKMGQRAVKRRSPTDAVKSLIGATRSFLKHNGGRYAHALWKYGQSNELTDSALFDLMECPNVLPQVRAPMLCVIEQFGLIELPADYSHLSPMPVHLELTDYCLDQAMIWIADENQRRYETWAYGQQKLEKSLVHSERRLTELQASVVRQAAEVERHTERLRTYSLSTPEQLTL